MIIAIYGSADVSSNKGASKHAKKIGQLLATKGHTIITGACPGIPFEAAKAAYKAGARVIGYSPAVNKKEHKTRFQDPTKYFTDMVFVPQDYEHIKNDAACYKYRNISSVMNCDKVIIIGGRYGTLDEFILAYEFGKEIGILQGTKGAAEIIETDIMESILKKIDKETGAKVCFKNSPRELLLTMKLI